VIASTVKAKNHQVSSRALGACLIQMWIPDRLIAEDALRMPSMALAEHGKKKAWFVLSSQFQ
jgi:hypothetical protein